jgi:hypothetical protein
MLGMVYNVSVDAELKQYLTGMEERIVTAIQEHVNQRIELVKEYVNERIELVKEHVDERTELVKEYVNERSELVETRLLTEFHKWASPAEARNRTISAALRAIDMEMEFISDRVSKLEGKQPQ